VIVIISPAKTLDFESKIPQFKTSEIIFPLEVSEILENCQKLSKADIAKLMTISPKLAELNYERFQNFDSKNNLSRAALFAYNGDVYDGFERSDYKQDDLDFAQSRLRIISGFYGLLRPLDSIKAYRLEMSIKLKNRLGANLYDFWREKVTEQLQQDLKQSGSDILVNLASNEYSDVIDQSLFKARVINVYFKEVREGVLKTVSINSKKARGVMANFIIRNKITEPSQIQKFNNLGYGFSAELSDQTNYYFVK